MRITVNFGKNKGKLANEIGHAHATTKGIPQDKEFWVTTPADGRNTSTTKSEVRFDMTG
jgi:hypothetical protein